MRKYITGFISAVCLIGIMGANECSAPRDEAQLAQTQATQKMTLEAERLHGMPNITEFTERGLAKYLFELRDRANLATYTYIVAMDGSLRFLCNSIGFGIPYSVQYTSPQKPADLTPNIAGYSPGVLPQPDPNGLYMPEGLSATFVICGTDDGEPSPMYVEPEILVSTIPLSHTSSYRN